MERLLHREFMTWARYIAWANARLHESVARWAGDEAAEPPTEVGTRLLALLNELLVTQRVWLARLQGYEAGVDAPDALLYDEFEALREAQLADDVALCDYVHGLAEEDMPRPVPYRDFDGTAHTNAQRELLAGLCLRQAQLRGRICELLRGFERPEPGLDFLDFLRDTRRRARA